MIERREREGERERKVEGESVKREGDAHGSLFERKILVKSSEQGNKAQRKVKL